MIVECLKLVQNAAKYVRIIPESLSSCILIITPYIEVSDAPIVKTGMQLNKNITFISM